ncbi:MAG: hypothetical protein MZV64_12425 [Ignavibacteriales bacterium]|nr:hypothetical protein [Ignavibacteriales bacterium]
MKKNETAKKGTLTFPDRKISEAFLDFSSPLLDTLGEAATKDEIDKILRITYTVWNAVVIDAVKGIANSCRWLENQAGMTECCLRD